MEQRLKFCRLAAKLSGPETAQGMGLHKDSYWRLEVHCQRMSCSHLVAFCDITQADVGFILHGVSQPPLIPLEGDTIGARIASLRRRAKLSVRAFNAKCGFPENSSSITSWERGRYIPEVRSILTIAKAFHINAASFLV